MISKELIEEVKNTIIQNYDPYLIILLKKCSEINKDFDTFEQTAIDLNPVTIATRCPNERALAKNSWMNVIDQIRL